MNIYFACSITGGRQDQQDYQAIVEALLQDGHYVPTAHLSGSEVMALEAVVDPVDVFTRDIEWIDTCQAVIAEVSTPSHGVGYEIAYALGKGKPVLCCYRQEARVSKMIIGNTHPLIQLASYKATEQLVELVRKYLLDISNQEHTTLDDNVNNITWNQ